MEKEPKQEAIVLRPSQEVGAPALPGVSQMLAAIVQGGVNKDNVGALEKMVDLYERMQKSDAEKAFAQAFRQMQSEMPRVIAERGVPGKDLKIKFRFAPYEAIMDQVSPMLEKYGFSVSFSTRYEGDRLTKICHLQHVAGHTRTTEFTVRVGQGPPNASSVQADGAASTYAKRFALCDTLNIKISQAAGDADDPHLEGHAITKEQAADLRRRVRETGADEKRFLEFAGAKTFEEITTGRYPALDANLRRKETTK